MNKSSFFLWRVSLLNVSPSNHVLGVISYRFRLIESVSCQKSHSQAVNICVPFRFSGSYMVML